MVAAKKSTELMIGVKSICDEFGITDEQFYMFLGIGMPVRKINSKWFGHRANISDFFRKVTTAGDPIQLDARRIRDMTGGEG